MPTLIPDRLSLRNVRLDYWRSLNKHGSGARDRVAVGIIFGSPLMLGGLSIWPMHLVLTQPTALLPAVSLLAGVLLAGASQVITLRARIADSLVLASDTRLTLHIRETLSGILLAALAALLDAVLLGTLTLVMADDHRWWHEALTGLIVTATTYIIVMFTITAQRLYTTYLEVFEGGAPLGKRRVD